jgi:L-methionine (R)-S-oxide reductase
MYSICAVVKSQYSSADWDPYFLPGPSFPTFAPENLYMAEDLTIAAGTKETQYQSLIPQIKGLLSGEPDLIANLANVAAALKEQFGWLWTGFYLVKQSELVLGPFQGPVACTRIRKGRGVCGTSWAEKRTLIVPDVEQFPGHIACSSLSRSEIVVPIIRHDEVLGVLDIDSAELATFDETDQQYLEEIVSLLDIRNHDCM